MSIAISTQTETPFPRPKDPLAHRLHLRCPRCFEVMSAIDPNQRASRPLCPACGFLFVNCEGIWRALNPERETHFQRFMSEYGIIRAREGRGSSDPDFYLGLPYRDLRGTNSWQWKIRCRSFRFLTDKILPVIEQEYPQGLDILDIGAGNGWLSYRLSLRGHRPVAVDLLDNDQDGLGAARHYDSHLAHPFPRFQAEMDRLPFVAGQFDAAIFNASFHYSENYTQTLREALRCLRGSGHLFILDSPFYDHGQSGRQMVEERRSAFERQFGFRSDSISSREYLTPQIVEELAVACSVTWKILEPWYGFGWALRPWKARLLGRRDPAKFYILWATMGSV